MTPERSSAGARGVQFDQSEEDVLGRELGGPAVGVGNGAVEVLVEVAEDRHESAEAFARAESVERLRAERIVKQAAENDRRQVNELGPFGQWMRDRMFPLFTPVIARELRRQYTALEHICARAA